MHKNPCHDCGPSPVNHAAERLAATLEWMAATVLRPFEALARAAARLAAPLRLERALPPLFRLLAATGLGAILEEPDAKNSLRTQCLWKAAAERGIRLKAFRLRGRNEGVFFANIRGAPLVFDGLPRPRGAWSRSLAWMDNKSLMKTRFRAAGIPVPRGETCVTRRAALRAFRLLEKPLVAKPIVGSRGRHTTVGIATENELLRAFAAAKQISPAVVVEEEVSGFVFRATLVGGRLVGVIRREPPHVVGDGLHSIAELVDRENAREARRGPVFYPIPKNDAARKELARQGFAWESVPKQNAFIRLGANVSRECGSSNTDVTDITHPANAALFARVGAALGDPLVGIDFMIDDIARPWTEAPRSGVIECNSLPFLDLHHYPFRGKPRDASGALWDFILERTPQKPVRRASTWT